MSEEMGCKKSEEDHFRSDTKNARVARTGFYVLLGM